jgi:glyoxylase-like metal-dependent hydrolase (beta-lactamase superfamily II)
MPLKIMTFPLGPLQTNTYLLVDAETKTAAIIDPTFSIHYLLEQIPELGITITDIWHTHAHFDHIAGTARAVQQAGPQVKIGLHPQDLDLWRSGGGGAQFGFTMDNHFDPNLVFEHGQQLLLGQTLVEVRHTPGHTPGHVIFYLPSEQTALCGDLIFQRSVGRTDLPGGSFKTLKASIFNQVFTLPDPTRLLCGHGDSTTVQEEKLENPYL